MIACLSISSSLSSWAGPLPDTDVLDSEFYSISIEPPSPQDGPLPNTDVSDFHSIPTESDSSSGASGTLPHLTHTMLVDCDSTSISSNSILEAVARPTAAAQIGLGHPGRASSVSSSSTAPSSSSRSRISSSTIRSSKSAGFSSRRESRWFGDAAEGQDDVSAGPSVIQEFIVRRELETLF